MTLSTLRTLLETATEAEQAEVLEMAFDVFLPRPCKCWNGNQWSDEYSAYHALRVRFCNMVEVGAYTDAALLIMREVLPGWKWALLSVSKMDNTCGLGPSNSQHPSHYGTNGAAMPLAIIAAICAAKEDDDA